MKRNKMGFLGALALVSVVLCAQFAQAAYVSFGGSIEGLGGIQPYQGHFFSDGNAFSGAINYDPMSRQVTSFWVDVVDNASSTFRFEVNNYPGSFIPQTDGSGPLAGDGDYFTVTNGGDYIEFEWYTRPEILQLDSVSQWQFNDSTNRFSIHGFATSVVPIPGAVWLLGSGLVGLVGFRKRFTA